MTAPAPLTVVFDLDGTLVETAPDLVDALTASLAQEGVPPLAYEQARDLIGAGARALVQRGLEVANHKVSPVRLNELHAYFIDHYSARIADKSLPYPGCLAALERLRASGARLAVCTNKIESLALKLLDALDMTRLFDAIVGGDTFATSKPEAEPLIGAVQRAGGDPTRAVMVGDSATDVGAAKAAGVPVIVMSFGYTLIPPADLGGDALIDHFDEIDAALEKVTAAAVTT